jgi:hypothetical protein
VAGEKVDGFQQALDLCRQTHYKKGLVKALTNIGILYSDQNEDEKAFGSLIRLL